MIRKLFSTLGLLIRLLLVLALVTGLVLVAFVAYKGSQPMQQDGADGMTHGIFLGEGISPIPDPIYLVFLKRFMEKPISSG